MTLNPSTYNLTPLTFHLKPQTPVPESLTPTRTNLPHFTLLKPLFRRNFYPISFCLRSIFLLFPRFFDRSDLPFCTQLFHSNFLPLSLFERRFFDEEVGDFICKHN